MSKFTATFTVWFCFLLSFGKWPIWPQHCQFFSLISIISPSLNLYHQWFNCTPIHSLNCLSTLYSHGSVFKERECFAPDQKQSRPASPPPSRNLDSHSFLHYRYRCRVRPLRHRRHQEAWHDPLRQVPGQPEGQVKPLLQSRNEWLPSLAEKSDCTSHIDYSYLICFQTSLNKIAFNYQTNDH